MPVFHGLSAPASLSVFKISQYPESNINVVNDLPVKHSNADEVRTVLEGIFKSFFGMDCSSCQDLEGYPGDFLLFHEFSGFIRKQAEHVVVELVVVCGFFAIHRKRYAVLFGMGGPVIVMMKCLQVKIGLNSCLITSLK